jgi:hypothetical protein
MASRAHGREGVGRRATRRRSTEPGRIQAQGEIVNGSSADGVLANDTPCRPLKMGYPAAATVELLGTGE